ncbi:amidase [Bosea sp. (in: a-proteobacteria)]|uniref:amidase n=1 Tax=Bosea sp. (in: a-proteobacteria) TaxID=1871050 RepID=UPI0040332552
MSDGVIIDRPLWQLSVCEASERIAAGTLSPVDLVEACLGRIAAVDGAIHSFIHVAAEQARAAAREAEAEIRAGRRRGPLHGIPYAVKDNYDAAGLPATAGSRVRLDHVPTQDAALVARLRAAGAILLGKLNTWEFGTGNGGEYFDLPFPTARNPWDTERFAGGSSTGAGTSVAAGTTLFALGSDTTGSVRLPAAATGTLGLIATSDVLDRSGILPNCYTLDKPGIFAWTARDAALVFGELTGKGPTVPGGPSLAGLRIAVVSDPGPGMPPPDAPLAAAFADAVALLAAEGAIIETVALPVSAADCYAVTRLIGPPESAAIHEKELRERPGELGFALRDKLMAGSLASAVDYIAAQRRRGQIAAEIDALIQRYDALVTYGPLHVAPRLGVEPEMTDFTTQTLLTPFNLSDHPALMQCIGFTPAGLPLCWQIVGRRHGESDILALAAAYEDRTPWRAQRAMTEAAR